MTSILAYAEYGGMYSRIGFLLSHLPVCEHYCEPFGGSAAALLNRVPSPIETWNDRDGDVVAFFRVLRTDYDEFMRRVGLTPYSRSEYDDAIEPQGYDCDMDRACAFYTRARMVRGGLVNAATPGRWLYSRVDSRRGMSSSVSRWLGGQQDLVHVANRLLSVQIEKDDAQAIIRRYDSGGTLFFCDPPAAPFAISGRRSYGAVLGEDKHKELANTLHEISGMAAITGPSVRFMRDLYSDWVMLPMAGDGDDGDDAMWMNYRVLTMTSSRLV